MKMFLLTLMISAGLFLSGCTTSIERQLIESPCKNCQGKPVFYDCGQWLGEKQ